MDDHEDLMRLADHVITRRRDLGMNTQLDLAQRARLSDRTVLELENGRRVARRSYAAIEQALAWKPGSARKIAAGGNPELMDSDSEHSLNAALQRIMDDPDLTDAEKRGAVQLLREMRNSERRSA